MMDSVNEENGSSLVQAQRHIAVPFKLPMLIKGQGKSVPEISRLFRVLPGKRLVGLAGCRDQKVVLKIFLGRTAHKYYKKELSGIHAINSLDIRTPALLWESRLADGSGYVLAFEYLEGCEDLEDVWDKTRTESEKISLLSACLQIFATMHERGMRQKDIHLNNFVMHHGRIYSIDGGGMHFGSGKAGLSKATSLNNLAKFFAQFKLANDANIRQVYHIYSEMRGWEKNADGFLELNKLISLKRQERKIHFLSKTLRDCSRFVCRKSPFSFMVCERSRDGECLREILSDPDAVIERARQEGNIIKDGNSATVALVQTADGDFVIKRYNARSVGRILRKALRASRARNSWVNAHQLDFLGVATVNPIALLEKRWGPFVGNAYFVSDYVDGIPLDQCSDIDLTGKGEVSGNMFSGIVSLLDALKRERITHGDLKATNFLYGKNGFVLLDLDSMKSHVEEGKFRRAYRKDMKRFLANWKSDPTLYSKFESALGELNASDMRSSKSAF